MSSLFCANFAHSRECWPTCNQVWCGECYSLHPLDRFSRHVPADESGFDWRPQEDLLHYTHGRNGDNLVTPFQCNLCIFRNLQCRNPLPGLQDDLLLCCIWRVNLDAVWGRESTTVASTLRCARQMVTMWHHVGLATAFPNMGPQPVKDSFGYSVAIAMVLKSLDPGRYAQYQQFKSIRKLRSTFSNIYMASVSGTNSLLSFGGDRAKHFLTDSPTQSLFFERFSLGRVHWMGQEVRQNWAITLPTIHALLDGLEVEWNDPELTQPSRELVGMLGAFTVIAFCGSFRGNEVFLVDLYGLLKYLRSPEVDEGTVIVPLLGHFKGETGECYHLTPLASATASGIQVKLWLERAVATKEKRFCTHGPLFGDIKGNILKAKVIELGLMDRLQNIKDTQPGIIPSDVDVYEDFGVSRSFRRGATSMARVRGVSDKYVELINRWRSFEDAKGRRPTMSMQDHYSDIQILLPELLKFSRAL
jgi:hypothetical protein